MERGQTIKIDFCRRSLFLRILLGFSISPLFLVAQVALAGGLGPSQQASTAGNSIGANDVETHWNPNKPEFMKPEKSICGQECLYQKANDNLFLQKSYTIERLELLRPLIEYKNSKGEGCFDADRNITDDCKKYYKGFRTTWNSRTDAQRFGNPGKGWDPVSPPASPNDNFVVDALGDFCVSGEKAGYCLDRYIKTAKAGLWKMRGAMMDNADMVRQLNGSGDQVSPQVNAEIQMDTREAWKQRQTPYFASLAELIELYENSPNERNKGERQKEYAGLMSVDWFQLGGKDTIVFDKVQRDKNDKEQGFMIKPRGADKDRDAEDAQKKAEGLQKAVKAYFAKLKKTNPLRPAGPKPDRNGKRQFTISEINLEAFVRARNGWINQEQDLIDQAKLKPKAKAKSPGKMWDSSAAAPQGRSTASGPAKAITGNEQRQVPAGYNVETTITPDPDVQKGYIQNMGIDRMLNSFENYSP